MHSSGLLTAVLQMSLVFIVETYDIISYKMLFDVFEVDWWLWESFVRTGENIHLHAEGVTPKGRGQWHIFLCTV